MRRAVMEVLIAGAANVDSNRIFKRPSWWFFHSIVLGHSISFAIVCIPTSDFSGTSTRDVNRPMLGKRTKIQFHPQEEWEPHVLPQDFMLSVVYLCVANSMTASTLIKRTIHCG